MTTCDVVSYGEIGVDNIIHVPHLPSPEVAAFPAGESYQIGGTAANTAVWLANWGITVRLAGNAIGRDDYGERLHRWLDHYPSLDLTHVERGEEIVTPFCRVMVTPDGERTFLIFGYPEAPKKPLTEPMLDGARYLVVDLYGGDERIAAATLARKETVQTVVGDVIWPDHRVLPLTDIATNSAAYIREAFPGVDVRQHSRELRATSEGIVITTDGPHSVHVVERNGQEFTVQPPRVEPVDATGAGDAFKAGLIFGMHQGWSLARSVCWAAAAGALGVQQVGAASDPPDQMRVAPLAEKLRPTPVA